MTDDQANRLYRFGDFVLDPLRYRLTRGPDLLSLPPRAFDVLVCLVERHGDVVTKDELLARVWPQTVVEENNLARQISTLRRALGDTRGQHEFIATIPAQGYRFVAPVARESRRPSGDRDTPPAVSIATAPPVEPEDSGDHGAEQERGGRATPPPSERLASGTLAAAAALLLVGVPLLWWSGSEAMSETAAGPGHLRRLTYGAGLQHQPAWSPDGRRVAFASDASGNSDIWIQEDGQPLPRALTSSPDAEWQPAWSPDGRWLAFRSERDGGGLYLMPAEGGDARRLTTFGHRPRWSPSGTHLLFSSSLLDGSKAAPWVVDVAAGGPRLLRPDVLSGYASAQVAWRPREDRMWDPLESTCRHASLSIL